MIVSKLGDLLGLMMVQVRGGFGHCSWLELASHSSCF